MTSPSQTDEDIDALAARWLVRAVSDEVTDDDILELTRWLDASPAHLAAYARAEAVWEAAAGLTPSPAFAEPATVVDLASRRVARSKPQGVWIYAGLAAAGIAAAAMLVMPHTKPASPVWQTFQTAKGERRSVQLADGSRLQLNTDTRLRVDLSHAGRRLVLDHGEVALSVTHDPARPLVLAAGGAVIRDIGTRFDVYADGAGVRVAVSEGRISLEAAATPGSAAQVAAGQQAAYDRARGVGPVGAAGTDEMDAWQTGRAIYRDVPLSRVVADLNRYVDKPLVVDGATGQLKVNAVLSLDSETKIVKALEAFLPVRAVETPDGIELRRR